MSFDMIEFLQLIGFGKWAEKYLSDDFYLAEATFADLVFDTLPCMLQLFLIIFLLNWIMGIIGDVTKFIARGGK